MKDLAPRLGVAAVGVPVLLGLLYLGGWPLGAMAAAVGALGTSELYRFAECRGVRPFAWMGIPATAGMILAAAAVPDFVALSPWILGGLFGLVAASLAASLWARGPGGAPLSAVAATALGVLYAGLPLVALLLLHALPARFGWGRLHASPWEGLMVVALPLAATMIGDSTAYFAGNAWGRKRLFPSVSPGKSWVGAWAGVGGAAGAAVLWWTVARSFLPGFPLREVAPLLLLGGVLGVAAILGDLAESLLKREAGVKDSGRLFPGHGGVLDRLDALVFTLPATLAILSWLEMAP